MKLWIWILCFTCIFKVATFLKLYESIIPLGEKAWVGLHYMKPNDQKEFTENSFTACTRFNYKLLGQWAASRIFSVGNGLWNSTGIQDFFSVSALYPLTWLILGYADANYFVWTLKYQEEDNFQIWKTNHWHHFCFAFDSKSSMVRIANVSHI